MINDAVGGVCEGARGRSTGVLFPVFSMRRKGDFGIGDTTAVKQCLDWLAAGKVGFLQLLPINVMGGDRSPYSAMSSVALDPIYLDVERIPGVGSAKLAKAREACGMARVAASVDYPRAWQAKSAVLRGAFATFLRTQKAKVGKKWGEFEGFKREQASWLVDYCRYRWLIEEAGGQEDWSLWPVAFNTAAKAKRYEKRRLAQAREEVEAAQDYYAWEQWHAFAQWESVRKHADRVGVRLMGDVPIGVSYASADVFFEPEWFHLDLFGGAPPEREFKADPFTEKWGQNWGVPVYRWEGIEKSDFRWWRQRVGALTSIFHQFRIDHILGFYRIYSFPWHPRRNEEFLPLTREEAIERCSGVDSGFYPRADASVVDQARNLLDGDRYIRAVIEAAGGAEVIGEDLGTVPPYVRPHLLELGVAGFKICQWERDAHGQVEDGANYPECSFACYSTHDMAPLKKQWQEAREEMVDAEASVKVRRAAEGRLRALCVFAGLPVLRKGKEYPVYSQKIKTALFRALLQTRSRYVALQINELVDSTVQVNFPGTVGDQNWTYRVRWEFESIPKPVSKSMGLFTEWIEKSQRA